MAVDSTKLLTEVLGLVDHLVKGDLSIRTSSSVVAAVGDNLGVVGGTTAVPGKELREIVSMISVVWCSRKTTYVRGVRWDVVKSTLG